MKQLTLFRDESPKEFGGSLLKGKRKSRRPLDTTKPIHLILKSNSDDLFLQNKNLIAEILTTYSARFGLTQYSQAIHFDHIHLSFTVTHRLLYNKWIRATTSRLAQKIPGLKFKFRPYARIVTWGREFTGVRNYIAINQREADFFLAAHQQVTKWDSFISNFILREGETIA